MTRDKGIDIAKGITILLVIVGHTNGIHPLLRNFIFSFHMPLFFLLAGYFYKEKNIADSAKSDAKRLLLPYLIACMLFITWNLLIFLRGSDLSHLEYACYGALWGSGAYMDTMLWGDQTPIGAIWFLPALFWCKNTYNIIHKYSKRPIVATLAIAIIATIIGKSIISLPLSFLQGVSAMSFYWIGHMVKDLKTNNKKKSIILTLGISCWIYSILRSHIYMVSCDYGIYPVDIIGASAGTYIIYRLSCKISNSKVGNFLSWCGINSLTILVIHFLENQCMYFWNIMHIPEDIVYRTPSKIGLALIITWLWILIQKNIIINNDKFRSNS